MGPEDCPHLHSILSCLPTAVSGGDIKEAVSGIPGWDTWGLLGRRQQVLAGTRGSRWEPGLQHPHSAFLLEAVQGSWPTGTSWLTTPRLHSCSGGELSDGPVCAGGCPHVTAAGLFFKWAFLPTWLFESRAAISSLFHGDPPPLDGDCHRIGTGSCPSLLRA